MPIKVRELKARLRKAGFYPRPGKGSHTVWKHPSLPGERLTLSSSMIPLIGFTLSRFLSFRDVGHTERPMKRLFDKDVMPLQAGLTMPKLQETLSLLLES